MGIPSGIALFSFMTGSVAGESRLKLLVLAGVVSAVVIFGSIAVVRFSNRNRQLTPAIIEAAHSLTSVPDSLVSELYPLGEFAKRRDDFAHELAVGSLPVDSVRTFYQSYALWMRDGHWDSSDVRRLAGFLGISAAP